jgi:hypothetical protein
MVANGNNDPWSEECYLNSSCQEQGNPCTANDVRLLGAYLADEFGMALPTCIIGQSQDVYLWGTFNNNTGTNRYAVRARTEVYLDGDFNVELNACSFDVLVAGETDVALLGVFTYTLGLPGKPPVERPVQIPLIAATTPRPSVRNSWPRLSFWRQTFLTNVERYLNRQQKSVLRI